MKKEVTIINLTTHYIVSRIVAEIMRNRKDLILANETVRDDKGQIIGCKSFSRL